METAVEMAAGTSTVSWARWHARKMILSGNTRTATRRNASSLALPPLRGFPGLLVTVGSVRGLHGGSLAGSSQRSGSRSDQMCPSEE